MHKTVVSVKTITKAVKNTEHFGTEEMMRKTAKMIEKRKTKMGGKRKGIIWIITAGTSLLLCACGVHTKEAAGAGSLPGQSLTAAETVECMLESMKTLDLDIFNARTDNYVQTEYNWIGLPVRNEYRVFDELLQPGIKLGKWKKKYEFNHRLSEKIMENLTWEIQHAEEDQDQAKIMVEITNLDMNVVMGMYEMNIMEKMIASEGTGLGEMVKELSSIADEDGSLLALMESCDQEATCTFDLTVTADRKNGAWIIHLDDELINACMGNINAEEYSEEVQQKIKELEAEQNEKLDEWAEDFGDNVERWVDGLFGE